MAKKNIYLLLILATMFVFSIIDTKIQSGISKHYYGGFGIVPAIFIGILSYIWCIEHAKHYEISHPKGSALLIAFVSPIGVPLYFFRGFGFKEGMRKTFKAIGFFLVLLIVGGSGVQVAENLMNEESIVQKVEVSKGIKNFDNGNYEDSFDELHDLAILDNADAQVRVAWMYDKGRGVKQKYKQAARWYTKAAEQGDALAQTELGRMYHHGHGVDKNTDYAIMWVRRAAEQGYADAQLGLGLTYTQGDNIDFEKAKYWLMKADENGADEAKEFLEVLK